MIKIREIFEELLKDKDQERTNHHDDEIHLIKDFELKQQNYEQKILN